MLVKPKILILLIEILFHCFRGGRVNEKLCSELNLSDIVSQFQTQVNELAKKNMKDENMKTILVEPVNWFSDVGHRFVRLGVSHSIAGTEMYTSGKLYGIDISSAAAVVALNISPGDQVLDFCCAPGAKTAMISDTLVYEERKLVALSENEDGPWAGSVTGVDIVPSRLASCRTLCKKYELGNVRLFLEDACLFNILAPEPRRIFSKQIPGTQKTMSPPVFPSDLHVDIPKTLTTVPSVPKRAAKSQRKRNKNALDKIFFSSEWKICLTACELYDKILVDAQCTLDASIRHLLQYSKVGWIDFEGNPSAVISELQKKMLFNAFRLLKPGGSLVYSTCSFCNAQNEDVVQWLLTHQPNAQVAPIVWPQSFAANVDPGHLPHTVRFYPKNSGTSGMFIAKIIKTAPETSSPLISTNLNEIP